MKKHIIKFVLLVSLTITGCTVDIKSKEIINQELKHQSISVIDNFFNLTYVENDAIAFGIFGSLSEEIRMPIIFALPTLISLLIMVMAWKVRKHTFRLLLPIFIVLGGAFGNIIDRAMHGYVTDFLHLHYFHQYNFYVFNVADVLVNIGIVLIIFQYKDFNKLIDGLYKRPLA